MGTGHEPSIIEVTDTVVCRLLNAAALAAPLLDYLEGSADSEEVEANAHHAARELRAAIRDMRDDLTPRK